MQKQAKEDPLLNACMMIGAVLAFSSIGGIIMPLLLDLPKTLTICACIQLASGVILAACGWLRLDAKAMWGILVTVVLLWLLNTGIFIFTFFSATR